MPQASTPEPFLRVATRPKWILALLAALALAAIFALLSQWQLNRSFRTVGQTATQQATYTPIDQLATPGQGFAESSDGRLAKVTCIHAPMNPLIVANRLQGGQNGYWLLSTCTTKDRKTLLTADAWFATRAEVEAARTKLRETIWAAVAEYTELRGWLLGPEAPEAAVEGEYLFNSLSIAQLANVISPKGPIEVYPGVLALERIPRTETDLAGAQAIKIETQEQAVELNFLNIFYAVEWVVFAGFAVFMWWRLVQDERLGLRADDAQQPSGRKVN